MSGPRKQWLNYFLTLMGIVVPIVTSIIIAWTSMSTQLARIEERLKDIPRAEARISVVESRLRTLELNVAHLRARLKK